SASAERRTKPQLRLEYHGRLSLLQSAERMQYCRPHAAYLGLHSPRWSLFNYRWLCLSRDEELRSDRHVLLRRPLCGIRQKFHVAERKPRHAKHVAVAQSTRRATDHQLWRRRPG